MTDGSESTSHQLASRIAELQNKSASTLRVTSTNEADPPQIDAIWPLKLVIIAH
jgi:hypothetical protein